MEQDSRDRALVCPAILSVLIIYLVELEFGCPMNLRRLHLHIDIGLVHFVSTKDGRGAGEVIDASLFPEEVLHLLHSLNLLRVDRFHVHDQARSDFSKTVLFLCFVR